MTTWSVGIHGEAAFGRSLRSRFTTRAPYACEKINAGWKAGTRLDAAGGAVTGVALGEDVLARVRSALENRVPPRSQRGRAASTDGHELDDGSEGTAGASFHDLERDDSSGKVGGDLHARVEGVVGGGVGGLVQRRLTALDREFLHVASVERALELAEEGIGAQRDAAHVV